MKIIEISIIPILLLSLIGCTTMGRNYDEEKLKNIIPNVSTKKDVIKLLGEPHSIGISNDNIIFKYFSYKFICYISRTKDLDIVFNNNDTVKEYSIIKHNAHQTF